VELLETWLPRKSEGAGEAVKALAAILSLIFCSFQSGA